MNQYTTKEGKHLGTLFIMHANGTRFTRRYCEHCQRETQQGKTVKDTDWQCLECLSSPVDLTK
jgi:hypothetical protein